MDVEDIGSGPPVLAIHGLGGGAYFFRSLAERLRHDYRIISVDLPTTPGCSMAAWVDELGTLIDERIGDAVFLVGHSMGTIIGLEAWRAWPEKLRGLIFVGGVPRIAPHIYARLSERVQALRDVPDLTGWGKKVSPGVFAADTYHRRPEAVGAFERLFEAQPVDNYVRCCEILIGANAEAIVPTVTVPCAAITGAEDQYAPPNAVREFVARLPAPCPVEIIEGAAHLPFLEQPDEFATAVRGFLARHP
jgi:pimeloyl-ACP methyl ester carboxylesterase